MKTLAGGNRCFGIPSSSGLATVFGLMLLLTVAAPSAVHAADWPLDGPGDLGCVNWPFPVIVDDECSCSGGGLMQLTEGFSVHEVSATEYASYHSSWLPGGIVGGNKEYVHTVVDYETNQATQAAVDVPSARYAPFVLALKRTFRSRLWQSGRPFGQHWRHNYAYELVLQESSNAFEAVVTFPNGEHWNYIDAGKTGTFVPFEHTTATESSLTRSGDEFLVTAKWGEQFHFAPMLDDVSVSHRPDWIQDRTGFRITFSYDGEADGMDRLVGIQDAYGRTMTWDWGLHYGAHVVTRVVLPEGREILFDHHTQDEYTVTYPNGDVSSYTRGVDADGTFFAFDDARGNPGGRKHRVYVSDGSLVRGVKDVDGNLLYVPRWITANEIRHEYASGGRESYVFGDDGFPVSMTDEHAGTTRTTTWDTWNRLVTTRTDDLGNQTSYVYDDHDLVQVVQPDGTSIAYEWVDDRIATITDELGCQTSFVYDGDGNVIQKTFADGAVESWTYDGYGNASSHVDPNGHTTVFEYDGWGNLAKVTLPDDDGDPLDNPVWTYTNSIHGQRLDATDPEGRFTAWEYDALDRLLSTIYPDGTSEELVYGDNGSDPADPAGDTGLVLARRDRNGNHTFYEYDGLDNLVRIDDELGTLVTRTYQPGTNLVTSEDRQGDVTWYAYDASGRLATRAVQADATTTLVSAYDHDALDRLVRTTDPYGFDTVLSYDWRGSVLTEDREYEPGHFATTTNSYDPVGRLVLMVDPELGEWATQYDCLGRVTARIDPLGGTRTYAYDPAGNLLLAVDEELNATNTTYTARDRVWTVEDPIHNVITYGYFLDDRVEDIANAGTGGKRSFTYTCCGRVSRETTYVDVVNDIVVHHDYDGNGNPLSRIDGEGHAWTTEYDERNRPIRQTDPLGEQTVRVHYESGSAFDARLLPGQGSAVATTDPDGNTTVTVRDGLDRTIAVIDPVGNADLVLYDALVPSGLVATVAVDREGRKTTSIRDGLQRVVETIDPLGRPAWMTHDGNGNRLTQVDASGNTTSYAYDSANRKVLEAYPDGGQVAFEWYANGWLKSRTDQEQVVKSIAYDGAGHPLLVGYSGPGVPPGLADVFAYDPGGRLVSASDGPYGHVVTRAYDPADRLVRELPDGQAVGMVYDRRSLVTSLTAPSGLVLSRAYSVRGELDTISSGATAFVDSAYDGGGRLIGRLFGNGTSVQVGFDARGWPTRVAHRAGAVDLQTVAYAYDRAGHKLQQVTRAAPRRREVFSYDDAYRMRGWARLVEGESMAGTSVKGPAGVIGVIGAEGLEPAGTSQQHWTLDALDNWEQTVLDGVLESRDHNEVNEVLGVDGVPYAHDANGNLTDDGTFAYEYDVNDRLRAIERLVDGAPVGEYEYDVFGRRVLRRDLVTPEEVTYRYDGAQVLEEFAPGGVLLASYVTGGATDDHVCRLTPSEAFYFHMDTRLSPLVLTNAAGEVVERYESTAYGQVTCYDEAWADPLTVSRVGNPYAHTGRRLDPESMLLYMRARYYSPSLGRFLGRDPMGYVDGMNLYAAYFVPTETDPFGLLIGLSAEQWCGLWVLVPCLGLCVPIMQANHDLGGMCVMRCMLLNEMCIENYNRPVGGGAPLGGNEPPGGWDDCRPGAVWTQVEQQSCQLDGCRGTMLSYSRYLCRKNSDGSTGWHLVGTWDNPCRVRHP